MLCMLSPRRATVYKPGSDRCTPQPRERATSSDEERSHHDSRARERPQQERHVWTVHHISCGGCSLSAVLVVVNAFFVAAEYALVRVRRTRMEALAAQGSSLARVVLHGLDHLSRYIAGVQVGITLAGLASGRFGEPVLAALFDPVFVLALSSVADGPRGKHRSSRPGWLSSSSPICSSCLVS